MDSQIVGITDLKEYDDQIKAWLPKKYIQVGANNTIQKPKISIVDDLPASPAADTIYFAKNASPTPTPGSNLTLSLEGIQLKDNNDVSAQVIVTCDETWDYSSTSLSGCSVSRSENVLTISMDMFSGGKGDTREFKITVTTEDGENSKWVSFVQQASYLVCTPDGGTIDDSVLLYNNRSIIVETNLDWIVSNLNAPSGCSATKTGNNAVVVLMPKYLGSKNATRDMTFDVESTGSIVITKSFTVTQKAVYVVPNIVLSTINANAHNKLEIGSIEHNDGYKIICNNILTNPIKILGLNNDNKIYCDAEQNISTSSRNNKFHLTNGDGSLSTGDNTITQEGSSTPTHTYHVQPLSYYFAYDELTYIEFTVKNENNINMNATAVSVNTDKFTAMLVTGGTVKVKPVGENTSGNLYTATMTITFTDDDGGTRTIDVLIHQENGHIYRVVPPSELFGYATTTPRDFEVLNEVDETQVITSAHIEGMDSYRFSAPVINTDSVSTAPNSVNMSGRYYEACLIIVADTIDGEKEFEVVIEQDYMG